MAIISIAQHARPNVTGQIDERLAQLTILSTVVRRTGTSSSGIVGHQQSGICNLHEQSTIAKSATGHLQPAASALMPPVEDPLSPHVDVAGEQDEKEQHHLDKPGPAELAQRHRE